MKTKYIFGAFLCGAMAVGFSSCDNDEFLDVNQYNIIATQAMFENEDNAKSGLNGVYDMMMPSAENGDWGFKPNLFTGCHPTIDTQATGWDKDWNSQNWNASSPELLQGWKHVYTAIQRANDFLAGLNEHGSNLDPAVVKSLKGEALALRGFFFHWLGSTFGRVPMLMTGENYVNTPTKERAATYTDMWDFVINDFKDASELLDWTPMDDKYGRATKGMALAYLADCYMWKAYRLTDGANGMATDAAAATECYKLAKAALESVINSGTYSLNKSFTTNWDPASAWGPEVLWVEQLDEGSNWGSWNDLTSNINLKWYVACPENGGWGSLFLSWEWYNDYEKGDKRRDGSCCTGAVIEGPDLVAKYEEYKSIYTSMDTISPIFKDNNPYLFAASIENPQEFNIVDRTSPCYGVNPYLQETLGHPATYWTKEDLESYAKSAGDKYKPELDPANYFKEGDLRSMPTKTNQYHFYNGEYAPSIWSTKLWRTSSAAYPGGGWGGGLWSSAPIYWKRYANVLIDYAECCFRLGDEATGWKYLDQIRERAFGILEDGSEAELTAKYLPFYNQIADYYAANGNAEAKQLTEYPIPFGSNGATVTPAKDYYTALKAEKGFTSEVWKVAVNEERRKEFNCEWCLRPDMQRSNYLEDHVVHNYPERNTPDAEMTSTPWTNRSYQYNDLKMDMPIPNDEILKNPACDQNPAYK